MKLVYNFDGSTMPSWMPLLFWLLYVVVFVYAFKKTMLSWYQNQRSKDVNWLFAIYFTLFAVFYCINDDYFQYRNWIYVRDFSVWGKEKFYIFVVLFCQSLHFDYPYEVFRFIVWGGAIFIVYYIFRKYRGLLMPGLALLFLFVFHAGTFCYARASLAMAVYFLGIAIYFGHKRLSTRILGIIVAISSYFFHHEMIIGIAVLPCLFFPFERKGMSYLSAFWLIIVIVVLSFFSSNAQFLDSIFDNDELSSKIENFNEKGQGAFRLSTLVNYLKFFYPFYLVTKYFWKNNIPRSVAGMYRITYGILMASVAFMVVSGVRTVYTYRVLYISMIPMTLLIGYGYNNGHFKKTQFLIMLILALLSNSIRFINAQ